MGCTAVYSQSVILNSQILVSPHGSWIRLPAVQLCIVWRLICTGRISLIRLCGSQGDQIDMKYLLCTADGLWIPNRNKDIEGLRWINSFNHFSHLISKKGCCERTCFWWCQTLPPKKGGSQLPLSSCISFQQVALIATGFLKFYRTPNAVREFAFNTGCIDSDSSSYSKRITSTCETKFPSTRKCTYYPSQKKMRRPKCPYFPVYIPRKTHVEGKRVFLITAAFMHWILWFLLNT